MPKWLRQFTFNQINSFYQKEAEAMESAQKGGGKSTHTTLVDSSGNINKEAWRNIQNQTPSAPKVKYGQKPQS